MEELFLDYKLAKDLQDLGLIVKDRLAFVGTNDRVYLCSENYAPHSSIDTLIWEQAFEFFREDYGLHYAIADKFEYWVGEKIGGFPTGKSETYKEARQACLEKLIEIAQKIVKGIG